MKKAKTEVEKLKSEILDTALDIFLTKNYSETNIRDISERLGVTRTPIYYHFNNKYEIYSQVVERYLEHKTVIFREILTAKEDFYVKVRNDLDVCTRQAISENVIFSEINTNPELSAILELREKTFDTIYGFKLDAVKEAIKNGELKADTDPNGLVDNLYLLHFGFLELSECTYHKFSQESIDRLIDMQIENIRRTYGTKAEG